jgi:polyhydroxybutyrate depolymerase
MPRSRLLALSLPLLILPLACESAAPVDTGSGGSPSPSGGVTGSGGVTASGGSGGSTGGSVIGSGGVVATGGQVATGGGSGGVGVGGQVATGGNIGSGGGSSIVTNPSAGCEKGAGRPSGGSVRVSGESFLEFPESYDGETPLPVLMGFHGCGAGNRGDASRTEYTDLTSDNVFEDEYVRAIPVSADSGGCWNYNTDIQRVKALYDDLLENYCVDVDRVYATGHSSGAQLIVQMLLGSHTADAEHMHFKAVAPVAASDYGAHATAVPAMYIQNQNDQERGGDGHEEVEQFVAGNMCASTSMPLEVTGAGCQSGGTTVDPGCISYDDCSVPTVWCSHNDPQYNGTGHGVPCFAMQAMDEFFKGLP